MKENKSQRRWCGLAQKQYSNEAVTKERLLLVLRDESSRALFEFPYILPTCMRVSRER